MAQAGGHSTDSTRSKGQAVLEYLLALGVTVVVLGLLAPLLRAAIALADTRFAAGLVALN